MRLVMLLGLLVGCMQAEGEEMEETVELDEISEQPLQGVIGGAAWSFAGGEVNTFLSDDTEFFTTFYDVVEGEDCSFSGGGQTDFILSIPTQVGAFPFTLVRNATFTQNNDNLVTTDGTVRLDSITDDEISGGVYAIFDDENEIDGTFTVARCPSDE